jgi:hypothetical protein
MKFTLQPFLNNEIVPDIEIVGEIDRHEAQLTLEYTLLGNLEEIIIAAPSATPSRQDELWKQTCFECFLGVKSSPQYWEFNLSPAGHWNIYRFEDYRHGMQEETAWTIFPFQVEQSSDRLILRLELNLDKIISAETEIEVGITTVIGDERGEVSYWALTHRGEKPDFHRRDSFAIAL